MFKNISKLGKHLSKSEQKSVTGGFRCTPYDCWVRYGGEFLTPEDFFCQGDACGLAAI